MSDKKEYIERGAFLAKLKEHHDYVMQDPAFSKLVKWREAMCYGRHKNLAEQAPAADVVEVKHGRWELYGNDDDCGKSYFCSVCGANYDEDWFYTHGEYTPFEHCPRCIAAMDGGADNG